MQKVKPRRFDSTASEDSISTEPSQDDKSSARFGSSGSLDFFTQNASSSASKKYSMDSRASQQQQQRGQRSTSSKTSTTSRTLISPPRAGANNKKLPPISNSSQAIILYCMENARGDVASRVVARMAHKRDDFSNYCANMAPEHWNEFVASLRTYLNEVVRHLQSAEKVYFPRRSIGFKADYFAVMANALTTECVFLDGAAHQPTEAIEAWAELVELMFSNVRDGYYQQIRFLRRNSQCYNGLFSQSSVSSELSADGSEGTPALPAAPSTTGTLVRQYSQEGASNNSIALNEIHQRFF
uniref:Uncharacterized protein n=1 Tax=Panagrolaimus sp. PS1159 TaxID=55785 RepID=A0AC35G7R4_9BILA